MAGDGVYPSAARGVREGAATVAVCRGMRTSARFSRLQPEPALVHANLAAGARGAAATLEGGAKLLAVLQSMDDLVPRPPPLARGALGKSVVAFKAEVARSARVAAVCTALGFGLGLVVMRRGT